MLKAAYKISRNFITAKFTFMLVVLISLVILSPYTADNEFMGWFVGFLTNAVIVVVAYVTRKHVAQFYLFILLAALNVMMHIVAVLHPTELLLFINHLFFLLFCIAAIIVFFNEIFSSQVITTDIILGSVCVYLLIGIAFGTTYIIIHSTVPGSFQYLGTVVTTSELTNFDFYYFSFITLTTVGFGDVIAFGSLAKSFVILESVTGIFYLATLVSRLVAARV